jgi:hypothetical protein
VRGKSVANNPGMAVAHGRRRPFREDPSPTRQQNTDASGTAGCSDHAASNSPRLISERQGTGREDRLLRPTLQPLAATFHLDCNDGFRPRQDRPSLFTYFRDRTLEDPVEIRVTPDGGDRLRCTKCSASKGSGTRRFDRVSRNVFPLFWATAYPFQVTRRPSQRFAAP